MRKRLARRIRAARYPCVRRPQGLYAYAPGARRCPGVRWGLDVAHLLARANIVTNKTLLPSDTPRDWIDPGLRLGTIEVTRASVC